jgi:hypothetical protein
VKTKKPENSYLQFSSGLQAAWAISLITVMHTLKIILLKMQVGFFKRKS